MACECLSSGWMLGGLPQVKSANGAFSKRVVAVPGGLDLMAAIGFAAQSVDGVSVYVPEESLYPGEAACTS